MVKGIYNAWHHFPLLGPFIIESDLQFGLVSSCGQGHRVIVPDQTDGRIKGSAVWQAFIRHANRILPDGRWGGYNLRRNAYRSRRNMAAGQN